jgi:5-methyltetrahydropteroyltriglutamate--homocysteine methyltransferase
MAPTKPPFRADHVGSLLRPEDLKAARARAERGELSPAQLRAVEDAAIAQVIRRQEDLGLQAITDGEFRRHAWQTDFLAGLDGAEEGVGQLPMPDGRLATFRVAKVVGKLGFSRHPMVFHFEFVRAHTRATPKMTIPSPTMMISVMRDWRGVVSPTAYTEVGPLLNDLAGAYRKAIRAFYDAGCRYLQLDDCNLAFLCDPVRQDALRQRGDDPQLLMRQFADAIGTAIADRPQDMTVTMHLCRGNLRSTWISQGGYEPIADVLFNTLALDGYFLEYDSERAGGFEPLRFLPRTGTGKIVLGLVTTKSGALESKDVIKRRVDEAAKFVDLDRLCLSPQCGFASTEQGNLLSEDEQWRKLALVRAVADEIWS